MKANLRIATSNGIDTVELFEDKAQLQPSNYRMGFKVNDKTLYAQIVTEDELNLCKNSGSGVALGIGVTNGIKINVARSAGDSYFPYTRKSKVLKTYMREVTQDNFDASQFPKGGYIQICGGVGGSSFVGHGGYGEIKLIQIPANKKVTLQNFNFNNTTASNGSKGSDYSRGGYSTSTYKVTPYCRCNYTTFTKSGSAGGSAGKDVSVEVLFDDSSIGVTTAFGGGGAGGQGATWTHLTSCSNSSGQNPNCSTNSSTFRGDNGLGGASGSGNTSTDSNGADGNSDPSFRKNDDIAHIVVHAYE